MRKRTAWVVLAFSLIASSGCSILCDRRDFAQKASNGAQPVVREYRDYVAKDPALSDGEKKMRNMLADELENLLKEGGK